MISDNKNIKEVFMFDDVDERARKIVNEFFARYEVKQKSKFSMVSPRVYLLAELTKALREECGKTEG
jgi:hypothetical protein